MTRTILPAPEAKPKAACDPNSVPKRRRQALRYTLVLVLLPLLAIPAAIELGRSNFFLHHGASVWVRSNDQVFDMRNRDCDVLVFGDSTAMTGIDPEVVEARTGFRTCNVAVTNAVLAVTGDLTLNHFLANNPKPRVLLIQLSPDDFQARNRAWHQTIYAEGLLELLRHGSPAVARRTLIQHPEEAVSFAGYAVGFSAWYALKQVWFHTTHLRPEEDTVTVRNGFFTPPSPARSTCVPANQRLEAPTPTQAAFSRDLVAGYQNGYAARAGVVLVNVAPIPSCDANLAAYAAQLDGVTSNQLLALPIGLFNDGRHYTARGSEVVSTLIARELNAVAARNPSIDDRIPATHTVMAALRPIHYRPRRPATTLAAQRTLSQPQALGLLIYPRDLLPIPAPITTQITDTPIAAPAQSAFTPISAQSTPTAFLR